VADSRSPDAIQREIEATRAELADTIDAIADRVSPKKAASRGAHAVKAKASAALGAAERSIGDAASKASEVVSHDGGDGGRSVATPASVERADSGRLDPTDAPNALHSVGNTELNGRPWAVLDATPEQAARREPVAVLGQRRLRTDRVLFAVGAASALLAVAVLARGRKS
jgi:hypothetical protein